MKYRVWLCRVMYVLFVACAITAYLIKDEHPIRSVALNYIGLPICAILVVASVYALNRARREQWRQVAQRRATARRQQTEQNEFMAEPALLPPANWKHEDVIVDVVTGVNTF